LKLLLFGKNGQIGRELQRSLAPLGDLVALDRHSTDFCGDLADLPALAKTVRALRPDVIVNAAAYTAVDRAESEPLEARNINALAPAVLAREAASLGACLVHYSTDYVFDGSGDRPWRESDEPAPLNQYGRTKLEGERAVQAACPHHLIFRTSWVYGDGGGNFLATLLQLMRERERIEVVDDQFGAPTGADWLADVTALALRELPGRPELAGLYHLTAAGETSRYAYARYVLEQAARQPSALKILAREVIPVRSSAMPTPALRPLNGRLDNSRACAALGLKLPPWREGVARALERMVPGSPLTR
jgi:dTDP-4-dehydrorhamnose reductase